MNSEHLPLQKGSYKFIDYVQDEVLERAKRAKEKAAREAMEAQGQTAKPVKVNTRPHGNGVPAVTSSATSDDFIPVDQSSTQPDIDDQDPVLGVSDED